MVKNSQYRKAMPLKNSCKLNPKHFMFALMNTKNFPENSVYTKLESPLGNLWMIASDDGLHALVWDKDLKEDKYKKAFKNFKESKNHPVLTKATKQLKEYFRGKRTEFDLPLSPCGTEFQMKAWKQLSKIPYGKTISYAEQAKRLGNPKAFRAVGTANSKNPISIIVPCHRVIATSGDLSGFGGGVHNKKFLLELEKKNH